MNDGLKTPGTIRTSANARPAGSVTADATDPSGEPERHETHQARKQEREAERAAKKQEREAKKQAEAAEHADRSGVRHQEPDSRDLTPEERAADERARIIAERRVREAQLPDMQRRVWRARAVCVSRTRIQPRADPRTGWSAGSQPSRESDV